jgi:tripartite-type tricarboxylate transporter receptor subunit TctC
MVFTRGLFRLYARTILLICSGYTDYVELEQQVKLRNPSWNRRERIMRYTRLMCASPLAMAALLCAPVAAQRAPDTYPYRSVTLIVPFAPGAVTDIETRLYAQKLSEATGRTFLVDHKPGAGSMIGTGYVAKAPADGYTVLATTPAISIAPLLYKNLGFDPLKDFTFVSMVSKRAPMLLANPSLPVKNVPEYIAYAKANPGKLNIGTSGPSGGAHLSMAWLHHVTNTKATFIHYKGGALSFTALMGGEVQVAIGSVIAMMPNVKAGKVKLLGMTSAERAKILPDIPTVAEQGVPGFEYAPWLGFAVPRATPTAIVARLNTELVNVTRSPELAAKLADDATIMVGSAPEQFAEAIAAEASRYKKLVDETGMKLEH